MPKKNTPVATGAQVKTTGEIVSHPTTTTQPPSVLGPYNGNSLPDGLVLKALKVRWSGLSESDQAYLERDYHRHYGAVLYGAPKAPPVIRQGPEGLMLILSSPLDPELETISELAYEESMVMDNALYDAHRLGGTLDDHLATRLEWPMEAYSG